VGVQGTSDGGLSKLKRQLVDIILGERFCVVWRAV
jgi:hypothetical protein